MKTTLNFLFCYLFLAAFIQAGQWDRSSFDVVSLRIPDRLCRVTLNRQEPGGEIDRRIQNLIDKNYMVIDLDGGWLNHFRNRTDRGGQSHVYYGIGKVFDAGSLFAACTVRGSTSIFLRTRLWTWPRNSASIEWKGWSSKEESWFSKTFRCMTPPTLIIEKSLLMPQASVMGVRRNL